jgi:hypothetical protein
MMIRCLVAAMLLATPALADEAEQHSLSDAQVAQVVKAHMTEINACWHQLDAKTRAGGCSVTLGLSIAPKGEVVDTTIISDAPAETRSCIAAATRTWVFPEVDLASDIEYPIALSSK